MEQIPLWTAYKTMLRQKTNFEMNLTKNVKMKQI